MNDKSNTGNSPSFTTELHDIESLRESNRNLVRAYRELFSLHSLSQQLGSLQDTSHLPALTFEQAGRILPFKAGCLFLNEDEPGTFSIKHTIGEEMDIPEMIGERGTSFIEWLEKHGRPVMVRPEIRTNSTETITNIFIPLQALRQIVGVLVLQTSLSEEQITQHQLTLLAILAAQIAVSFDNSRLYVDLSEKNRELLSLSRDLETSRERLRMFNEELEKKVKKRTEALRAANERLKEADRVKADFLANMSHELKTPLNAIIGFSDVLLDGLKGGLEPVQAGYVEKINENGRNLFGMINQILDLSRIESGRLVLVISKFKIADLIPSCMSSVEPLAASKNISIEFSTSEPEILLEADREKVAGILNNLLGNAVKFTGENGKINVSVSRTGPAEDSEERQEFVEISVSDTGIGIEKKYLDVVFERFRQIDSSPSRTYSGTGLGLAIAKEFVELHGGKISVKSPSPAFKGERGATFTFTLPAG